MLARLLIALILALSLPLAPASAQSGAGRLLLWNADTGAHTSAAIDADGDLVLGEPGSQVLALLKGSPPPKIVATKMGLVIAGAISTRKSGIQVLAIGNDGSLRYGPASTSCTDRDAPLIAPTVPPFLVCISATQGNAVVVEVENDLKTSERFRGALDLEDVGSLSFKQLIPTTQGALALLSGTTPLVMMRVENGGRRLEQCQQICFQSG